MDKFVNLAIIRNPVNWLIIFSMLLFAAYCGFTIWNATKGNLDLG